MRPLLAARTTLAGAVFIGSVLAGCSSAGAAAIVEPGASVVVVANAPMTVVASGFAPGALVYVEQCDGVPTSAKGWDVTIDCDNGASPPAAVADAQGRASFPADKPNRAFRAFQGESPSSLFNCIAPGGTPPANSLQTFTNCQLRVSSNNTAVTDDQVFQPIVLSARSAPLTVPSTATSTTPGRASSQPPQAARRGKGAVSTPVKSRRGGTSPTTPGRWLPSRTDRAAAVASASSSSAAPSRSDGAGALALSDGTVAAGYLLIAIGLLLAVGSAFVTVRRRARPGGASVTGTSTAGERT